MILVLGGTGTTGQLVARKLAERGKRFQVAARRPPADGEIISATGTGRVAVIGPADIAEVAVRALTDPEPHNTDHVLTGPQPLNYDDVAVHMTEYWGHPVRHRPGTAAALTARLVATGTPADFATLLASLDVAIAAGAEGTPNVQKSRRREARDSATAAGVTSGPDLPLHLQLDDL